MDKKHLIIGLTIAFGALYLTFRNVPLDELVASFKQIEYVYLLPSGIIFILSIILRAYRWKFLILSIKETTTSRLMGPVTIGFMGNLLPARAGEFIRAYLLGKKENISFSASFATIFVERIFDTFTLMFIIVWLLLFKPGVFDGIEGYGGYSMIELMRKFGWLSLTVSVFIVTFSYSLIHWNERMIKLIKFFTRPLSESLREKVLGLVDSFISGLHVLKDFKSLLIISGLSIAMWTLITLTYYPICLAFGINDLSITAILVLMVSVCIFITIFPTPGFLGSFQLGCVVALHNIFHVSEANAASFAMVAWLLQFGLLIILGTYYILREGLSINKLVHVKEEIDA